jgi:hypothetical protein
LDNWDIESIGYVARRFIRLWRINMGNTKYKHTQIGDIAMRHLLAAVFVILALFAVSNVYAGELSVTKCTVTAGSKVNSDKISFSGTMDATVGDFSDANNSSDANFVEVTISDENAEDMAPCVFTFPVNGKTFKKGKFKCSASNTSFAFDTKTSKFSFTAKNVSLKGLSCLFNARIDIGDYNAETEVGEAIVNGPKTPIPINLMMGIKNVLRADSYKVTRGKKLDSDQLTVKGAFVVEDTTVNMANEEFVVTLGSQTFTLPAGSFEAKTGQFTCSKADVTEGGIASATFNFTKCSFTITIKNMTITAGSGAVDFCVAFAGYSQCVQVTIPSAPSGGAEGYQYWKSNDNASYYLLDFYGEQTTKVTGKPFLVLTYDKITLDITDCEFGLSEVTQEIIADGGIYEPTLDAGTIDFHEKLSLKSPVDLCVSWSINLPGGDNKSTIINGVQQFSFLHPANAIGPGKNSEEWIFNYTNVTMTGGVTNVDTYYFLGRESGTNAFILRKL